MRRLGEVFVDSDVALDGNDFANCRFERCRLIFSGGSVSLAHNQIIDCRWVFSGAAMQTLQFMAALYPDARELIEATFNDIRGQANRGGPPGLVN